MLRLVFTTLRRRPLRTALTVFGVAIAVAVLALIESIGARYKSQLTRELNSMGIHLMLVPLGCPYDAAARVLKGNRLETSLPEEALRAAKQDTAVEIAAPLLLAAVPREEQGGPICSLGSTNPALPSNAGGMLKQAQIDSIPPTPSFSEPTPPRSSFVLPAIRFIALKLAGILSWPVF